MHAKHLVPLRFDWVLVANAARARLFVRDPDNGAMRESAAFVHPASRVAARHLDHDRAGRALKSGSAGTGLAPRTDAHTRETTVFARELGEYIEEAAQAHRFERLVVLAAPEFLGELRPRLGSGTARRLHASIALDLTGCQGRELEQRVSEALAAAAPAVEPQAETAR